MYIKISLHCISGADKGKKWNFTFVGGETVVIGRLEGCHVVLDDLLVSQSHCLLQLQNKFLCLIDMGSKHGTRVNKESIVTFHPGNSDVIALGETELQLKILQPRGYIAPQPLPVKQKTTTVEKEFVEKIATDEPIIESEDPSELTEDREKDSFLTISRPLRAKETSTEIRQLAEELKQADQREDILGLEKELLEAEAKTGGVQDHTLFQLSYRKQNLPVDKDSLDTPTCIDKNIHRSNEDLDTPAYIHKQNDLDTPTSIDKKTFKREDLLHRSGNLDVPTSMSKKSIKIPTSSSILCVLCRKNTGNTRMSVPLWHYCKSCASFARFIQDNLKQSYQIIGEPLRVDPHGVLLIVVKEMEKYFLYVSRIYCNQLPLTLLQRSKEVTQCEEKYIYPLLECETIDNRYCVLLPFYPGRFMKLEDLFYLKTKQAIDLVLKISQAIEYAFDQNWGAYGSISPGTIFWRIDNHPLLYGYGLPRQLYLLDLYPPREFAEDEYFLFAAPEYLQNPGDVSQTSEIFSLASMLFSALCHKTVYQKQNYLEQLQEIESFRLRSFDEGVKPLVKNVLRKALAANPQERYKYIADFVDVISMVKCSY